MKHKIAIWHKRKQETLAHAAEEAKILARKKGKRRARRVIGMPLH